MQNFWRKFNSNFFLRLGLGVMFLYSGYETVARPMLRQSLWAELPALIRPYLLVVPVEVWLRTLGIGEVILAAAFLAWFLPRRVVFSVSLVAAVEIGLILLALGITPLTYPYLGALAAALGIVLAYRRGW
jgi:hypothetical protein